ncbi:site-specific integrase [uncultured Erythrobacter sp.]|uniref:site-specific integrase n=1 Tax=uncultured Erythrobacter sp. TaxID=263913 RepID=UPI002636E159|nr:site-specific integrase [uncultured Erythrobacter sp.]
MSLADAAKAWREKGGKTRSLTTINKEISAVSAFFAWLKRNVYVEENVALGFRSKVDKSKGKYPPYRDVELVKVFNSSLFAGSGAEKAYTNGRANTRDWRYWLPLCLLYSGARTGEIIQLDCSDVRQEHGVWIFDLVESSENEDKRLKNKASRRIVPIHPTLIKCGFLKHVEMMTEAKHTRVFPDVETGPRGDWSYKPSKFWANYLKRLGMKRKGLCLHSFRHTFTDECRRRGVDEGLTSALLGHANHSQTGHYGSIPVGPLMQRKEAIARLSFGDLAVNARLSSKP